MGRFFEPFDCSAFHWVLLLVVWFTKSVLDVQFAVDLQNFLALFFLRIVAAKETGSSIFANKISVQLGKSALVLESIDINTMGLGSIPYLGPGMAMLKAGTVGKDWVCRDRFIEARDVSKWGTRFQVTS